MDTTPDSSVEVSRNMRLQASTNTSFPRARHIANRRPPVGPRPNNGSWAGHCSLATGRHAHDGRRNISVGWCLVVRLGLLQLKHMRICTQIPPQRPGFFFFFPSFLFFSSLVATFFPDAVVVFLLAPGATLITPSHNSLSHAHRAGRCKQWRCARGNEQSSLQAVCVRRKMTSSFMQLYLAR